MMKARNKLVRFLGGLTLGEGVATVLGAAWMIGYSGGWSAAARAAGPGVTEVAYTALAVTLFLGLALASSGSQLWEQRAGGLSLLALALAGEFELHGVPVASVCFGLSTRVVTASQGVGAGLAAMTIQAATGYPILAAGLFYPAYKALVPDARVPQPAVGSTGVTGEARHVLRSLSVLTLLEVGAGLLRVEPALRAARSSAGDPWFQGFTGVAGAVHAAIAVNVLFDLGLAAAAVFLWQLRGRSGLLTLLIVILSEAVYRGLCVIVAFGARGQGGVSNLGLDRSLIVGDFSLQVQFLTVFPVLAVGMILLAHRRARGGVSAAGTASAADPARM